MATIPLYSIYDFLINSLQLFRRLNGWIPTVRVPLYTLTTLPFEVMVEVMKEFDWHTLLLVRQTCKYLNGISRTRGIWSGQYHQYVAQHAWTARLEEPLCSYSGEDLERWVLLRRSADIGWASENIKFTRKREINLRSVKRCNVGGVFLVPGGRWLLVGGMDGSVAACDLDASTLTVTPLIPPDVDEQCVEFIAIDMKSAEQYPNLTFTMALSPASHLGLPSGSSPLKIHIWRVTLTGHGNTAQLMANGLCSYEADDTCGIEDITISGDFFARTHFRNSFSYIEVFDWAHSTSTSHQKAIILPGVPIEAIRLLPGNRLLAFSREYMLIYSFNNTKGMDITPPTATYNVTNPLWKVAFLGARTNRGGLSEGLSNEIASYLVVKAKGLHCLVVPNDDDQSPSFRELMVFDHPGLPTCAVGFQKAFVQHSDRSITRLSFSGKPETVGICSISHFINYPTTPTGARLPKFDEETGRIVQDSKDGILIIDTAVLYTK